MDFSVRTQKLLKKIFGETEGPITTSGQKILLAQLMPEQLTEAVSKELSLMYNEGWTDAMAFFANLTSHVEEAVEKELLRDGGHSCISGSKKEPQSILINRVPRDPQ